MDNIRLKPYHLNQNYLISISGKVYSSLSQKWLSLINRGNGYLCVRLSIDGKFKQLSVHRIVAETFIINPENKPQVNHRNGIKTDNRVENLEWVTRCENQTHAWISGLHENTRIANSKKKLWATNKEIRPLFIKRVSVAVKKRWDSGSMNHLKKKVLDTGSGRIFESAYAAAIAFGMTRGALCRKLSGIRKNNTPLKYL